MAPASSVARSAIDSLVGLSQPLIATSQEALSTVVTGIIDCAKLASWNYGRRGSRGGTCCA